MTPLPSFITAVPLRAVSRRRAAALRTCTRRACKPAQAQLFGSIEDMPAEVIPSAGGEMPEHWGRPGVYGVYSVRGELQYVAAVRDVAAAIREHQRFVGRAEERYAVRMMCVERVEDAPLGEIAETWVMAHAHAAGVPPGNGDAAPEWRLERVAGDVLVRGDAGIKRVVRENDVVLFMKGVRDRPRCGFSAAVVDVLMEALGEDFVCVDCLDERNEGVREGVKAFTGWPTLPQLFVRGEFVGGADIVRELKSSGELQAMLEGVGGASA